MGRGRGGAEEEEESGEKRMRNVWKEHEEMDARWRMELTIWRRACALGGRRAAALLAVAERRDERRGSPGGAGRGAQGAKGAPGTEGTVGADGTKCTEGTEAQRIVTWGWRW